MENNYSINSEENIRKWQEYQNLVKEEITLNDIINVHHETSLESLKKNIIEYYKSKLTIKETCDFNSRLLGISNNINPTNAVLIENTERELSQIFDPINKFLFHFRNDHSLILKLIENISKSEEIDELVNLLCHFFYDNILIQNPETEEILVLIYQLLEKEINNLKTPSVSSFLFSSFIGKFLKSLTRRQDIKSYLSMILGDLILEMENSTENFLEVDPMRIYDHMKNKNSTEKIMNKKVFEMNKKNILGDRIRKTTITKKHLKEEMNIINSNFDVGENEEVEMNNDYLIDLSEDELRFRFETEEIPEMKEYYHRLLLRIDDDKNMYTNQKFLDHLSVYSNDSLKVLSTYKRNFEKIKFFIDKFFNNLIENDSIIPYVIKCICKMINVLISKKFPTLGFHDKNSFIGEFVFGKLIMPILTNPDYNGIISTSIISINTRKNLCNINQILKKIYRATFFESTREMNFTIFNTYLVEIMPMIIGFFGKLNLVKLPKIIEERINNNILNEKLNYNYFNENNDQLINLQSICFSIQDLNIFIKTVKNNINQISENNILKRSLEKIDYQENFLQNKIKEATSQNIKKYFIIFNIINNPNKLDILVAKQNRFTLTNTQIDHEFLLSRVKYCIKTILRNLNIISINVYSHLKECDTTEKLFEALNKIITLEDYSDNLTNDKVPLNWYSLYLNSNLMYLNEEYNLNNHKFLYEELLNEAKNEVENLNFKSNLMITKFGMNLRCQEKICELLRKDMFKVKQVEKFIRVEKFIESGKISICLKNNPNKNEDCFLILNRPENCVHFKLQNLEKQLEGRNQKIEGHSENISEFINLLKNYKEIKEDILQGDQKYKTYDIIDQYLFFIKDEMSRHILFQNIFDDDNLQMALEDIENYILDKIYKNVFPIEVSDKDKLFYEQCDKLKWITPIHLEINKKYINENLWMSAIKHLNRIDHEKSPVSKLKCVQSAYKIINNCIIFCSGKDEGAGVDDIIPILIYVIVKSKLKRIFSNVNYIKTFMNPSKLLATYGFLLTQVEMAMEFICAINHQVLKISEEEFNKNILT